MFSRGTALLVAFAVHLDNCDAFSKKPEFTDVKHVSTLGTEAIWEHDKPATGDISAADMLDADVLPTSLMAYAAVAAPDRGYGHIAQHVVYHNTLEEVKTFPMRRPWLFNLYLATAKCWSADLIVQLTEIHSNGDNGKRFDWQRSLAFAVFGFLYVGLVEWVLYVSLMTYLEPNAIVFANEPWHEKLRNFMGQEDLAKQVLLDNLIFIPFTYFPTFYMLKELVESNFTRLSAIGDGLRKYRTNFMSDNLLSLVFWVPGDFLAFAAPIYMRLPLDHAIAFSWTIVLSARRGASGPLPGKDGAES